MKDYSIYKFYKGEKDNPFEKELNSKVTKEHKFYNEYSIPREEVIKLNAFMMLWSIESVLENRFNNYNYNSWKLTLGPYAKGLNLKDSTAKPSKDQKKLFLNCFLDMYFNTRGEDYKEFYYSKR